MVAWIKTTIIKSHTPYIASAHTSNTQRTHFQHRRRSAAVTCERCSHVSVWALGCEHTHSFRFFTPFASMSGGRLHKLWEVKGLHTRKGGFIYVDRAAEKQTYFPTLLKLRKPELDLDFLLHPSSCYGCYYHSVGQSHLICSLMH